MIISALTVAVGGQKPLAPGATLPPSANLPFLPLNTKDYEVIELGKYVVDEYNKVTNSLFKLVFKEVLEAIYRGNITLVVAATKNNELEEYQAEVFNAKDHTKLLSFEQLP
ncbi:hypothetical protein ACS0TY_016529 [Phlomoides rotata]